ncbi:hypothetical protein [Spiroplasma citri]|nr:hypothetical protein [Spiroplasma citri]
MKKLLSILTISTLTASIPAPLLAAVPLTNSLYIKLVFSLSLILK